MRDLRRFLPTLLGLAVFAAPVCGQSTDEGAGRYRAGKLGEAEKVLRASADQKPDDARARFFLALTLAEQNKVGDAEKVVDLLKQSAADSSWTHLAEARVQIGKKDFGGAEANVKKAADSAGDSAEVLFIRGVLNAVRQSNQAAVDDLEKSIQKDASNAYAHYYAGLAYNGLKKRDKMVEHFQHFLRLAPDAPQSGKVRAAVKAVG